MYIVVPVVSCSFVVALFVAVVVDKSEKNDVALRFKTVVGFLVGVLVSLGDSEGGLSLGAPLGVWEGVVDGVVDGVEDGGAVGLLLG